MAYHRGVWCLDVPEEVDKFPDWSEASIGDFCLEPWQLRGIAPQDEDTATTNAIYPADKFHNGYLWEKSTSGYI
jgi:hypothetical protein